MRGKKTANLIGLAAKTDNHNGSKICMTRIARNGPAQDIHGVAFRSHAAARFVRKGNDAIDVGVASQKPFACERVFAEGIGDVAPYARGAIHGG